MSGDQLRQHSCRLVGGVPTVKQMWPFICQFVDKLFRETIEPAVQTANPYLSSFCFSKIDMGDKVTGGTEPVETGRLKSLFKSI
ncbi:Extended synaptotagmin-2-B [Liparis tanakae]|uniref:Extended synaptotagmin-2-B n=1 Tax=Liparis tanakae TaxID=230148 RepID=A0A4Z2EIK1_9TELE|nr:Extended synaptotagmin-2-B [Liparis tanakae]